MAVEKNGNAIVVTGGTLRLLSLIVSIMGLLFVIFTFYIGKMSATTRNFAVLNEKVQSHEERISKLEDDISSMKELLYDIKGDVKYIKERIK